MKYLPYFVIILILILLVFAALLWLKPDSMSSLIALEREVSEEALKAKGMKVDVLQELKKKDLDPRILKLALDVLASDYTPEYAEKTLEEVLVDGEVANRVYQHFEWNLGRALEYNDMDLNAIDKLSMEELKDIHDVHQQKVRRYWAKFSKLTYEMMEDLAESSIFTYESDAKVSVSIPHEEMTPKQREHLKLIKEYIKDARKGHYETKIIVRSTPDAAQITYFQFLPRGSRGGSSRPSQFVIDRKTDNRIGGVIIGGGGTWEHYRF